MQKYNSFFFLFGIFGAFAPWLFGAPACAEPLLSLSGYKLTFNEQFLSPDISAHGPDGRWIAHTPWNGDFGDAAFDDPSPVGPFTFGAAGLSITARKDATGKWHAGLICSVDRDGAGQRGFTQRYGYFEMKAELPDGPGVWPAFWLIGTDKKAGSSEIDVLEYYGVSDSIFHSTEHFWANGADRFNSTMATHVAPGLLSRQFNTYGVLITPQRTSFYLNRQEIWSTPTPPQYRQPMYVLANLALGGGWPIDRLHSPQVMRIAYIQVYQKDF